jgi:hypothetical protein
MVETVLLSCKLINRKLKDTARWKAADDRYQRAGMIREIYYFERQRQKVSVPVTDGSDTVNDCEKDNLFARRVKTFWSKLASNAGTSARAGHPCSLDKHEASDTNVTMHWQG